LEGEVKKGWLGENPKGVQGPYWTAVPSRIIMKIIIIINI
jgi:hypothetical protein